LEVVAKAIHPLNVCSGSSYAPGYIMDYFYNNFGRNISVVIQLLSAAM